MTKKRFLIFGVLLLAIFLIFATYAFAGCCFHKDYFCQDVVSEADCCADTGGICPIGIYDISPCSQTECEDYGCCAKTCLNVQYKSCDPTSVFTKDDYDCTQTEDCQKGCCIYLQQGAVVLCDDNGGQGKYKKDCVTYPPYDSVIFYDLIGDECTDICGQGTTPKGNVEGHVSGSGTVLSNVYVVVEDGKSAYTDSTGYYKIEDVNAGIQTITAYYEGYAPVEDTVTISEGETSTKDFELTTQISTGTVQGYVWNITDRLPVSGAYVFWSGGYAYTDSNGVYTLNDVYKEFQQITATADGLDPKTETTNIIAGKINYLNFTLLPTQQISNVCGDRTIEGIEQCDDGNTDNYDGCNSECEIELCGVNLGDCCEFDYLCQGNFLTEVANCGSFYYGCCNVNCLDVPKCINGYPDDKIIADTEFDAMNPGPNCECGTGDFYNTEDAIEKNGYCCNLNFQYTPCSGALGKLSGFVRDEDNEGINDAVVSAGSYSDLTKFIGTPPEPGFYDINLPAKAYNVTVSKAGYKTAIIENIRVYSGEETNLNITLEKISTECAGDMPSPLVTVKNIKGTTKLNITWVQQCKDKVDYLIFYLLRDGKPIGGGFSRYAEYYIDEGSDLLEGELQWDTTYTYTLNVTTDNFGSNSTTVVKNTGNMLCKGIFGNEEICLDNNLNYNIPMTKRAYCDYLNQPREIEDCIITQGAKSICVGPVNNITWCGDSSDCKSIGSPENVFGLYYDNNNYYPVNAPTKSCLLSDINNVSERNYCYYDYSSTIVDKCIDCYQKGKCYDYNSSDACNTDNCYYGPVNNVMCRWAQGYYSELGKGICYAEGYEGTDYCSLCNEENSVFENFGCTTLFCGFLGKCYSEDNTRCVPCDSSITCEDYDDIEGCIGGSEFDIPWTTCKSAVAFDNSKDSCKLKKCKWVDDKCFKDGDDDGKIDCRSFDKDCQKDTTSPITIIEKKPVVITSKGEDLMFDVSDYNSINSSYYCVGKGICCPAKEILNNGITLPNDDSSDLFGVEGNYNISFFSVDEYNNIEEIKTETLFIDSKAPNIYLMETVTDNPGSNTTSDIEINISVDEFSLCNDQILGSAPVSNKVKNQQINNSYKVIYSDISDGNYYYSVTCTDRYGNENKVEDNLLIDRVHKITDATPSGETIADSTVTLHLETSDKIYCMYNFLGTWKNFNQDYTQTSFNGEGIPYPADCNPYLQICTYVYNNYERALEPETYNLDVECWSQPNRQGDRIDSTNLLFTVDTIAPETKALYEVSTGKYSEIIEEDYYQTPDIMFNCSDESLGPPNEFGCKEGATKYCVGNSQCIPDLIYSEPLKIFDLYETGRYWLCYNSEDKGGNKEEIRCASVNIDKTPPQISISMPSNYYVTNKKVLAVYGSWQDESGANIMIEWYNSTDKTEKLADIIGTTSGTFSSSIELYDGENTIKSIAEDNAKPTKNKNNDVITAYYDLIGPEINAKIYNSTNRIDSDCIADCADGENRYDIKFNLTVKDEEWCSFYYSDDIKIVKMSVECVSEMCSSFGKKDYILAAEGNNTGKYEKVIGVEDGLTVGNYSVTYYAEDTLGNPSIKTQTFSIFDRTPIDIEVIEPKIDRVNNNKPIIKIITNEKSDCEMEYSIEGGLTVDKFTTTDKFNHTLQLSQTLKYEDGKDTTNNLEIICADEFGGKTKKSYSLVVDLSEPKLYEFSSTWGMITDSTDDYKYYLVLNDEQDKTKLKVKASEDVRCRYDSGVDDYSEMMDRFYNYEIWNTDFETDWIHIEDNKKYLFNIACEDMVGWITGTKTIGLEVNYSKPIMIFDVLPSGYINNATPEMSVRTIRKADCFAGSVPIGNSDSYNSWAFDIKEGVFKTDNALMGDGGEVHRTQVVNISSNNLAKIPLEEDKEYSFKITCFDPDDMFGSGSADVEFSTDYTLAKPVITSPSYSITNSSVAVVSGYTEEASYVQIYINDEAVLYNPVYTEDGTFSESLTLDDGINVIKVEVTDKGGNINSEIVNVNYINIGPSVLIILPENRGPFNKINEIAAVFVDNGGGIDLKKSYIRLTRLNDNMEINTVKEIKGNNSLVYNISEALSSSYYRADAVPVDNLGNIGDIDTLLFEINENAPGIDIISPKNMETTTNQIVLFKGRVLTSQIISSLNVVLNGVSSGLPATYDFSKYITLKEGMNTLYVNLNTTTGNYGESPSIYVFLDTTGPIACIDIDGVLQCPGVSDIDIMAEETLLEKIEKILLKIKEGLYVER